MKNVCLAIAVCCALSLNAQAGGVITCYDGVNGDPTTLRSGACTTQVDFSTFSDSVDWSALGGNVGNTWNTMTLGSWNAVSTGGITASLNQGPGFTGNPVLQRADNGKFYDSGGGNWDLAPGSMFIGHFDSIPNPGAGASYGDHLVGFAESQGPLLIQFSSAITSVGFYISTKNTVGVDATIKAYNVLNPTTGTAPVLSYRVTDTQGGGENCVGLGNVPPVPCNDAPFLAINALSGQFTSIVISTTDTNGFYMDRMYINASGPADVPEPASDLLIGGGILLLGFVAQKLRARS